MAFSLESREPLLDDDLVEWGTRFPLAWKLRAGRNKWLLRRLAGRFVPAELLDRPKQGFVVTTSAGCAGRSLTGRASAARMTRSSSGCPSSGGCAPSARAAPLGSARCPSPALDRAHPARVRTPMADLDLGRHGSSYPARDPLHGRGEEQSVSSSTQAAGSAAPASRSMAKPVRPRASPSQHRRTAVSERSSSFAIAPMLRPLVRISSTTSALYSLVNPRRFRLAMTHSYRTSVRSEVSAKPGQAHDSYRKRQRPGDTKAAAPRTRSSQDPTWLLNHPRSERAMHRPGLGPWIMIVRIRPGS